SCGRYVSNPICQKRADDAMRPSRCQYGMRDVARRPLCGRPIVAMARFAVEPAASATWICGAQLFHIGGPYWGTVPATALEGPHAGSTTVWIAVIAAVH